MLRRRDFRIDFVECDAAVRAAALAAGRRNRHVDATLLLVVLPLIALVLTSLVPVIGIPLTGKTATLANYDYVLFEHAAAKRAFANSFGMSATAALVIVLIAVPLAYFLVWRRSRLLRILNLAAEMPYALPGVVLAIAAILVFLKPLPLLGISLYGTIWIILFCYIARFLVLGLRPVISVTTSSTARSRRPRRSSGQGFLGVSSPSSFRWLRRQPPRARSSSFSPPSTSSRCQRSSGHQARKPSASSSFRFSKGAIRPTRRRWRCSPSG